MDEMRCPVCGIRMSLRNITRRVRSVEITYSVYVCDVCGVEVGRLEHADAIMRTLIEAMGGLNDRVQV